MKQSLILSAAICAALAATGQAATSEDDRVGAPVSFDAMDIDGNGEISREEMTRLRQNRWREADADGDGELSREELNQAAAARAQERVDRMIERLDSNADGSLSTNELAQADVSGRMFSRVDRNDDGIVSRSEFDAARARMRQKHRPHDRVD